MDNFDISQFFGELPPFSPDTKALLETSFDFSTLMEDVNMEQTAEQGYQVNTLAEGQPWVELLDNGYSMEETTTEPIIGLEMFGQEISDNTAEHDTFIPQLEAYVPEYTITNAQIDPELLMRDSLINPQYISSNPVPQPQELTFDETMYHALSQVSISEFDFDPTTEQVDTSDFFQSTATVPRLAVNGTYRVQHDKTGVGHEYTLYLPLPAWYPPGIADGVTYNERGFLRKDIKFTSETLTSFIRRKYLPPSHPHPQILTHPPDHPLRSSLTLRIEKHPYEIKARFSGKSKPKYTCCRSSTCALGTNFKVGDIRVAIDELSSRFSPQHVQNADPYFASGFLHLQCLESLIDISPLVTLGVLIPDTRKDFAHEPPAGKGAKSNNKMALNNKELAAFSNWKGATATAAAPRSGNQSLTARIWLANCKKSRSKNLARAPPGVTKADVDAQNEVHTLWGGRRAVGKSIEEMNRLEAEGRLDELIAPRNGTTMKRGMGPTGSTAERNNRKRRVDGGEVVGSKRRKGLESSSPDLNLRKVTSPSQNISPPKKTVAANNRPTKKARTQESIIVHQDLDDYSYLLASLPTTPTVARTKITLGLEIVEPLKEIPVAATRLTLPRQAHKKVVSYAEKMDVDEDKENVDPWEQVSPFDDESPFLQWV